MCFSQIRALLRLGFATTLVLLCGCGLNFGEKAPAPVSARFKGDYSCMSKISENVERYFNDSLSEPEINSFFGCMKSAFTTFGELVAPHDGDLYDANELRNFIQHNFLTDRVITDELRDQMMVLKQVLVGGSATKVSRKELGLAVDILEDVRVEALRLRPHVRVLNPKLSEGQLKGRALKKELASLQTDLDESIRVIGKRLKDSKQPYPLNNIEQLLSELRIFLRWDEHFKTGLDSKAWIDFLKIFKQMTVSPKYPSRIEVSEWNDLLTSALRWYTVYIQFDLGLDVNEFLENEGLETTLDFADQVFHLAEQSLSRQPGRAIPVSELTNLASKLRDLGLISKDIRVCSIKSALRAVLNRIFGYSDQIPSQNQESYLTLSNVLAIKDEFYRFAYIQIGLDSEARAQSTTKSLFLPSIPKPSMLVDGFPTEVHGYSASDWRDFLKVRDMRPLFPDGKDRVYLVRSDQLSANHLFQGFHNLTAMNLLRTATRLIFRGYANSDNSRIGWNSGLTSEQVQDFYLQFRDIGIDLGVIDPRTASAGARSFLEGNLFTYASDGFDPAAPITDNAARLSFSENIQLFGYLYSAGGFAGNSYDYFKTRCPLQDFDYLKREKIDRACVAREMPEYLINSPYTDHLPQLRAYMASIPSDKQQEYIQNMMAAAYSPFSVPNLIETSEITVLVAIFQYSESSMTRFDLDGDGILNFAEVDKGSKVFTGFIKKYAKIQKNLDLDDEQARRVFITIMRDKQIPDGFWGGWLIYSPWEWGFDKSELHVDRLGLSQVFKVIIEHLNEVSASSTANQAPTRTGSIISPTCE